MHTETHGAVRVVEHTPQSLAAVVYKSVENAALHCLQLSSDTSPPLIKLPRNVSV